MVLFPEIFRQCMSKVQWMNFSFNVTAPHINCMKQYSCSVLWSTLIVDANSLAFLFTSCTNYAINKPTQLSSFFSEKFARPLGGFCTSYVTWPSWFHHVTFPCWNSWSLICHSWSCFCRFKSTKFQFYPF